MPKHTTRPKPRLRKTVRQRLAAARKGKAARLKDAVDLDSVRDDLAGVVQQVLEPAHVSVWVSQATEPAPPAATM